MALKSLLGIKSVGGFALTDMDELRKKNPTRFTESGAMDPDWFETQVRPYNFMYVRHDKNSIAFTIQNGLTGEKGTNGCRVDTIVEVAKIMLEHLNEELPCRENSLAITKLEEALMWLSQRTRNRRARGVEGTDKA